MMPLDGFRIALQRLSPDAVMPVLATAGSYGYDLALTKDTTWNPGEVQIAPCGFKLAEDLPRFEQGRNGLAMLIIPRSSLFLKHGLLIPNSPGLIDSDYTGPIGVILWRPAVTSHHGDGPLTLPAGTRVAQALFVPVQLPHLRETDTVAVRSERGGFGSTG